MIELLVDALATFRVTRLAVEDVLTADLRDAVIETIYVKAGKSEWARDRFLTGEHAAGEWAEVVAHDPDPPKLATLATCPWCAGMYVSAGVAVLRRVAPRVWAPLARVLALSAAAGIIASATE